jgi:hypothetical protein
MRTSDEIARDADAMVPWRRVWILVGIALALVVAGLIYAGTLLRAFAELAAGLRSLVG